MRTVGVASKHVGMTYRKIRMSLFQGVMGIEKQVEKYLIPHCQEKLLLSKLLPVPQTDTGRRGEYPKTSGRIFVKELGKITP